MRNDRLSETRVPGKAAALVAAALSCFALMLCGCGLGTAGPAATGTVPTPTAGGPISGIVQGGQQPIYGAVIQLYEVGTTGNASAAKALLTGAPVTTSLTGTFLITSSFSCDSSSSVLYLTAIGGNSSPTDPPPVPAIDNTAIAQMAGLGNCDAILNATSPVHISINEVTTVASVFALSGFISDYANVGSASDNAAGVAAAYATQQALASITGGTSPGSTASGVTIPSAKIYSLANSIAACVNQPSSTAPACAALFAAATPAGGSAPTDTTAALANIVHNPTLNVAAIFDNAGSKPVFGSALTTAPADWTMPVVYSGGGLALPNGIAIDAAGNAWVANEGGNDVTELSAGSFASGTGGYASTSIVGPQGIAIDGSGNVWLANTGGNSVLKLNASGSITDTLTSGISGPVSVAIDNSSNVWVANFDSNSVAAFTSSGTPLTNSPFTNAALLSPTGVAVDGSNNVWVGSSQGDSVVELNSAGVFKSADTDGLLIAPGGVATDLAHNRVWTAATGIGAISCLTGAGGSCGSGPYVGGGLAQPLAVAVDGNGNVWTVNNATAGSVSEFSSAGLALTPSTGLGALNLPVNLALDGAGNLWTSDAGDNTVTEFVGLGAPTLTPLVASSR